MTGCSLLRFLRLSFCCLTVLLSYRAVTEDKPAEVRYESHLVVPEPVVLYGVNRGAVRLCHAGYVSCLIIYKCDLVVFQQDYGEVSKCCGVGPSS